jgi:anti-anti-sigma regulatory factor
MRDNLMIVDKEVSVKNIMNFYNSLKEEIENNSQVILDFTKSTRIDSSAAQVIFAASRKAKELDKTISYVGASPGMQLLLKLSGIKMQ